MTRFSAYPKYKDSGVEWLGEVPEGWDTSKIKYSTYVKGRIGWQGLKSDEFVDTGPYLVTGTDFVRGKINWETCYHVSENRYKEDPYIHLRNSDLLITKDGSIGKIAIVEKLSDKATLNSGIFLIRCIDKTYVTKYMFYLLNSDIFISFIDFKKAGTTISHLYQNVFVDFSYPQPPLPEQTTIATFLDCETARIDALIEKKERLIALLEEKRAALISHAVTKGLDPDAKMKDSGEQGIGMMPMGWKLLKFKKCVDIKSGQIDPESNKYRSYILIAPNHIESSTGRILFTETAEEQSAESGKYLFEKDEVLYSKIRPHLKKACFPKFEGLCSADVYPLKPKTTIDGDFLLFWLC